MSASGATAPSDGLRSQTESIESTTSDVNLLPQTDPTPPPQKTPFAKVGDYVMSTAWRGNAMGRVYKVGQVIKITPTGKVKIAFLPFETVNWKQEDFFIQSWEKIITSHVPMADKTLLVSRDGTYGTGTDYLRFEVIPESRLDEGFKERYDGYN